MTAQQMIYEVESLSNVGEGRGVGPNTVMSSIACVKSKAIKRRVVMIRITRAANNNFRGKEVSPFFLTERKKWESQKVKLTTPYKLQ